jgi:hypothetical protein
MFKEIYRTMGDSTGVAFDFAFRPIEVITRTLILLCDSRFPVISATRASDILCVTRRFGKGTHVEISKSVKVGE